MARLSAATLCVRDSCSLPRRHQTGCDNAENIKEDGCQGCLPAQAADGLKLCSLHTERIGEDALLCARLHTDLELQLRRQGCGEVTSGSRDKSNMPDQQVMDARFHLHALLAGMVELMTFERGLSVPGLKVSTRPTRDADRSEQGTARQKASEVEVLAALVVRHAEWFAARDDAGKHSLALNEACHGKVRLRKGDEAKVSIWSLCYPTRSKDFQEIGTCPLTVTVWAEDGSLSEELCGGRVFWYPEQSSLAYCDSCDQAETLEWWRLKIMGNPDAEIDTVAGAAWLSDKWRRPVQPSQLANWASRGKLARLTETVEGKDDPQPKRDGRGRQLYRLDELERCAAKMFGPPAVVSSRGKLAAA